MFNSGFNDAKLLNEFVEYAQTKEVPKDEKGLEASGKQISINFMKGLIARNLYNVSAYFEVIGSSDDDIIKAVEILKNEDMFKKLTLAR